MGVGYDVEDGVLCIAVEGSFSTDDLFECGRTAYEDARVAHPVRLVMDVARSEMSAPMSQIRRRIGFISEFKALMEPRIAVVVGGNDLQRGITQMAAAYAQPEGFDIRVFETREKALAWIRADR